MPTLSTGTYTLYYIVQVGGKGEIVPIIFIIVHLTVNLTIFGDADTFNRYAHTLHSPDWILTAAEV